MFGAPFIPTDKEAVPTEIQKLFNDYKNNFGIDIKDPWDPNITYDERIERTRKIFEKEAIFHIRFERIHPFQDGNGRTGRIILNHNLIQNKLAPVLITGVMSDDYKEYINNNDVDGLAKFLFSSSSQQATNWTSLVMTGLKVNKTNINPKNEKLAQIGRFEQYIKVLKK
ncbi:MAG: Fic family protein [Bacilli bacterium]|nr:Fic family protein [Bacilli bacterium]MBR2711782.1 Fic family protein [Bacilli bacterium]